MQTQKIKILIILSFFIFISCNKDKASLEISDFSESNSVTVTPYKYKPYAMFKIEIKGYTNDTIIIKTEGTYNLDLRLNGVIDTLWQSDYYGEGSIKCIFKPYKATKGKLKIDINL